MGSPTIVSDLAIPWTQPREGRGGGVLVLADVLQRLQSGGIDSATTVALAVQEVRVTGFLFFFFLFFFFFFFFFFIGLGCQGLACRIQDRGSSHSLGRLGVPRVTRRDHHTLRTRLRRCTRSVHRTQDRCPTDSPHRRLGKPHSSRLLYPLRSCLGNISAIRESSGREFISSVHSLSMRFSTQYFLRFFSCLTLSSL